MDEGMGRRQLDWNKNGRGVAWHGTANGRNTEYGGVRINGGGKISRGGTWSKKTL